MFIKIEDTPNPETLKFIPDDKLKIEKSVFIKKSESSKAGAFVKTIFEIEGVKSILLDSDFISITKEEKDSWDILKTIITSKISSFLKKEGKIGSLENLNKDNKPNSTALTPLEKKICDLLENKVKPVVATHGGEISFHSFKKGTVFLELKGSCAGCPSSTATLKMGIENMLKHFIEEVDEVVDINS
jgi:Fe-S cluster biogenesis protein NfuA